MSIATRQIAAKIPQRPNNSLSSQVPIPPRDDPEILAQAREYGINLAEPLPPELDEKIDIDRPQLPKPKDSFQKDILRSLANIEDEDGDYNFSDFFESSYFLEIDDQGKTIVKQENIDKLFALTDYALRNIERGFLERHGVKKEVFAYFLTNSVDTFPEYLFELMDTNHRSELANLRYLFSGDPNLERHVGKTILRNIAFFDTNYDIRDGMDRILANFSYVFNDASDLIREFFVDTHRQQVEIFNNAWNAFIHYQRNFELEADDYETELDDNWLGREDNVYEAEVDFYETEAMDPSSSQEAHDNFRERMYELKDHQALYESIYRIMRTDLMRDPDKIDFAKLTHLMTAFVSDIPSSVEADDVSQDTQIKVELGSSGYHHMENLLGLKDFEALQITVSDLMAAYQKASLTQLSKDEIFETFSSVLETLAQFPQQNDKFMAILVNALSELDLEKAQKLYLNILQKFQEENDDLSSYPYKPLFSMLQSLDEIEDEALRKAFARLLVLELQASDYAALEAEDAETKNYNASSNLAYTFFDVLYQNGILQKESKSKLLLDLIADQSLDLENLITSLEASHPIVRTTELNDITAPDETDLRLIDTEEVDRWDFIEIIASQALLAESSIELEAAAKFRNYLSNFKDIETQYYPKTKEFLAQAS